MVSDFEYEVMQMKRLAGQARHRKHGSQSRKCPMSTDHMTHKEWKERCGEVMTYRLGVPMEWKDFRNLPQDIQKTYMEQIMDTYSATATDFARMFGVTVNTVLRVCGDGGIGITFRHGRKMDARQRSEFDAFINRAADIDAKSGGAYAENYSDDIDASEDMSMSGFELDFCGKLDMDMVSNSIAAMLPIGTNVRIKIRCEILG